VSLWLKALRRATWMPEIPAHRVIKASGDIGGFGGTAGLSQTPVQRKKALLEAEGLEFQVVDLFSTALPPA
jgi:alkylated DNA nucleotide flippase Atl1